MTSTQCANTKSGHTMIDCPCDYMHIYIGVISGFLLWVEVMWTFLNPLHHSSWAAPKWLHVLSTEQTAVQVSCHTVRTHEHTHTWRIRARCERTQMKAAPPSSLLRSGGDWNFLHNISRMNAESNSSGTRLCQKYRCQPSGGARGEVRGSLKSSVLIIWGQ